MITRKDLDNLSYLRQEIKQLQGKIARYKPAEVVIDSVRASSPTFPYVEHTVRIEGLEQKKDNLGEYISKLQGFQKKLEEEEERIEKEIQNIPSSEIRMIIRYRYFEGLSYLQIMHKMGYGAPETPRLKLVRFFGG